MVALFLGMCVLAFLLKQQWEQNQRLLTNLRDSYANTDQLKEIGSQPVPVSPQQNSEPTDYRSTMLTQRKFNNIDYKAYMLDAPGTFENPVFIVEANELPVVMSNMYRDYNYDALFDFFGNTMYVVNYAEKSLDSYNMTKTKPSFIESIALPIANSGSLQSTVSSINCNQTNCLITMPFHQQATCTVTFDPVTKLFDKPICNNP